MVSYNDINSFIIDENHVLFFDIFYRNNEVILICPPYDNSSINHNNIQILHNFGLLKLKRRIIDNEWERVMVLIYEISCNDTMIDLNVIYNNNLKQYRLTCDIKLSKTILALTTLFKYDFYLMPIFHDFYKYQGVQSFFMYYNGTITDDIRNYMNYDDVILIEWNFAYWHRGMGVCPTRGISPHHAQPGQINHALYKYGKILSDYMVFNDLDEYMHIDGCKLIDFISKMKLTDSFIFWNYWTDTLDGNIKSKIPLEFYTDEGEEGKLDYRTKSIHKVSTADLVGIHLGKQYNKKESLLYNKDKLRHFHFYTWSSRRNKDNIKTVNKKISIKLDGY
jgi:hypothetical protein